MNLLAGVDWKQVFVPEGALAELFVRGSVVFLALFSLLRFVFKRPLGALGISDLLVVGLIAEASQHALGEFKSVTDSLIIVAVIIFWNYTLEWLGYQFPRFNRVLHPPPLPLAENGRLLPENMKKEFITKEELMSQLRDMGVEDLQEVRKAYMEGNGRVSVIKAREDDSVDARQKDLPTA